MENVNCPRCGVSTPELPGPFGKFCGNCEPAARAGCRILDHGFTPAAPPAIPTSKCPELDEISKDLAYAVSMEINKRTAAVTSKMPYKAQYVLEELIKLLREKV